MSSVVVKLRIDETKSVNFQARDRTVKAGDGSTCTVAAHAGSSHRRPIVHVSQPRSSTDELRLRRRRTVRGHVHVKRSGTRRTTGALDGVAARRRRGRSPGVPGARTAASSRRPAPAYCPLISPPSNGKGNMVVQAVVVHPAATCSPGKFNNTGNFKIGTALIARTLDIDINPNLDGSPVIGEDAAASHQRRRRVHRPDRRPGVDEHAGRVPRAPEQRNRRPEDPVLGHQEVTTRSKLRKATTPCRSQPSTSLRSSTYLRAMTAAGATDLMLTAHTQPRMRVDGRLGPIDGQPVADAGRAASRSSRPADRPSCAPSCTRRRKSTSRSRTATRTASVATASSSRASSRCRCGRSRSQIPSFDDAAACRRAASTSATCRRVSCSSPARPAPASRRRSRR